MRLIDCVARGIVIAALVCLSACAGGTQHGDARLYEGSYSRFFPAAVGELKFPKIPIGTSGTFRYRVLSLSSVIYPRNFLLKVPWEEEMKIDRFIRGAATAERADVPWSGCVIRASLLTPDGKIFHQKTIMLGRDRGISHPGGIVFPFTDYLPSGRTQLAHHLSYDLQVEVLRPSLRRSDVLSVEAHFNPPAPPLPVQPTSKRNQ